MQDLTKLEDFKEILGMLGFCGKYPAGLPNGKF